MHLTGLPPLQNPRMVRRTQDRLNFACACFIVQSELNALMCKDAHDHVCAPAVLHSGPSASAAKEVLGSRKSVRRNKLPLPSSYDLLLQLFGECCSLFSACWPHTHEIIMMVYIIASAALVACWTQL